MSKSLDPLATPNPYDKEGCVEMAHSLNLLVADAFSLYLKTKNFHWHLSGKHFRDYHLLFDEQSDQIFAMIDVLAERVRKLGRPTIHSTGEVARLQRITDDDTPFLEAEKMVSALLKDNQSYAKYLHETHKICERYNDVGTTSILEVFLDETERRIWFLFEINEN